jgi:hypothetical protein
MHRIHGTYLPQAGDISKFRKGRSAISASTTSQNPSNLFLANAFLDRPNLFGGQAATVLAGASSVSPIRSWLAKAGAGDLDVGAGPESLELCVRCGEFG